MSEEPGDRAGKNEMATRQIVVGREAPWPNGHRSTPHRCHRGVVGSPWFGPLLESFVGGELAEQATWAERPVPIAQYRDRDQREVDVVIERDRVVLGDLLVDVPVSTLWG